ncbi:unnamed protein product, partial [Amoebophrya sp. A25]
PRYLTARGSARAWQMIQALIEEKDTSTECQGNFLLYWLHNFDRQGLNRVGWDAFEREAGRVLARTGRYSDSDIERVIASAWVYLDESRDGTISMDEVDVVASDVLTKFRDWCKRHWGSVHQTFSALDLGGDGDMSFTIFRTACKRWPGFSDDDLSLLIKVISPGMNH